jgi:Ras-related protein Rab-1A
VAQLYKFMDDRGTPINKVPAVGSRDLDLYRLFRILENMGGYNRVTNQMKWRAVNARMGLPTTLPAANQTKAAYKK